MARMQHRRTIVRDTREARRIDALGTAEFLGEVGRAGKAQRSARAAELAAFAKVQAKRPLKPGAR